jgi:hypothetical protein
MIEPYVRPYEPGDLDELIANEPPFYQKVLSNLPPRPAYTVYFEGQKMMCGGVNIFWPGVGEAWAYISPKIAVFKRPLLVYTRQYLDHMMETEGLWRLQAVVRSDFPAALRFARHLGFEVESKLIGYGIDKTDCFMFTKVKL